MAGNKIGACEAVIEPCSSLDELGDLRGQIKKLRNERNFDRDFLRAIFEKRDKQLHPRDLLAAFLPTRRSARTCAAKAPGSTGRRAVGILRRSLRVDKAHSCSLLHIDFVFVTTQARGMHIGRKLLNAGIRLGKQKDVRLSVAGSEENLAAVKLYESVGFRWTSELKTEMLLEKSQLPPQCSSGVEGVVQAAPAQSEATKSETQTATTAAAALAQGRKPGSWATYPPQPIVPKLCVDVVTQGGVSGASGATPHLSQLRLSPLGSPDFSSPSLSTHVPMRDRATGKAGKRLAQLPALSFPAQSLPFEGLPDVKSMKAAHDASPRSPARRAMIAI
mmetsp:Transcript_14206/g.23638  ORF Transcript_14206/g.23638 Transcript_14206/m.23638 type:complete len:333 (+) Transcript_14206:47-1045(+)|eukprot:CAMPEP_0119336298 /NCGR_PEP_ID=MMETSP1333-20130426/91508_1 /TAXON_ID=418940 /ORGANISM="Scyphosphaera apsteinii, Strain RCC1455" /LENGTH=332 /DNA_ID=CAMNT_0007347069 /DNA_START=25 /DNA_END=1023 /DNA_ORIENTATION=+